MVDLYGINIGKYTLRPRPMGIRQWGKKQLSSVFFCVVAPIHWEIDLREAYASLRGVKGSLRGGVLFGVAYAGGYARIFSPAGLKKSALSKATLVILSRNLAFCGFISFHFGLLWLHFVSFWPLCLPQKCLVCVAKGPMAASFIASKTWGISCLRGAYAEVTQRLRGGSWYSF